MVLGLAIAITCLVAQDFEYQTEFTIIQPPEVSGGILTININPGAEVNRAQSLARAASVLGLVVFGSGVVQFRKAWKGNSEAKLAKNQ